MSHFDILCLHSGIRVESGPLTPASFLRATQVKFLSVVWGAGMDETDASASTWHKIKTTGNHKACKSLLSLSW